MKTYRATSLWFHWNDAIYPDKGIEEQIKLKAEKCRQAGIDLVIVFGFHFRWDYIYIWDRIHELFKFTCDVFHKNNILVFDHHSANLTHRPRTLDDKWDIYHKNRHHVPFYPSADAARELTQNGVHLDSFRMVDVVSGEPCYLPGYTAEIFCMNNENFRAGYRSYLKKLFSAAPIDGLMCDDIFYYTGWHGCGCDFCRKKFYRQYGHTLPAANDRTFWGNYGNKAFRDWVNMRYQDSADFLSMVRDEIGRETPLLSCCSSSIAKWTDVTALNAGILTQTCNHMMLEMCGEIVGLDGGFYDHLLEVMYHQGISKSKNIPNLGLGYAFYPDTAFFVWALNKLMGNSTWVSTLKGRLGIPEADLGRLPDEWDIVGDCFNFEKKYASIYEALPDNRIAVYFSFNTKVFYGDSEEDYAALFSVLVQEMFKNNTAFEVLNIIPEPEHYPVLILNDAVCLGKEEQDAIESYIGKGGAVIACGGTGLLNDKGDSLNTKFLEKFGIRIILPEPEREIDLEKVFAPGQWPVKRQVVSEVKILEGREKLNAEKCLEIKSGKGNFFWTPRRCNNNEIAQELMKKAEQFIASEIKIKVPSGWHYRFFRKGNKKYIHFLSGNVKPVMEKIYSDKTRNTPIIRFLKYKTPAGTAEIISSAGKIRIYSPDLPKPVEIKTKNSKVVIPLEKIKRYFIAELF